jgi:hypothetical protein
MTDLQLERLADLLGCDVDYGEVCAEIIRRNREGERMRKQIGDLRALVLRLQRLRGADQDEAAEKLSVAWLLLDALARGEVGCLQAVQTAAAEMLRVQQCPGWKRRTADHTNGTDGSDPCPSESSVVQPPNGR